jgi:hypothetical protein
MFTRVEVIGTVQQQTMGVWLMGQRVVSALQAFRECSNHLKGYKKLF